MLHDAWGYTIAQLGVCYFGQHHVAVIVQLPVVNWVQTPGRRFHNFTYVVDSISVVQVDEPSISLKHNEYLFKTMLSAFS